MKFPNFVSTRSRPTQINQPALNQQENRKNSPPGSAWSTGLLMVGSALVGATAVAVWNRRTITEMRNHMLLNSGQSASAKTEDETQIADEIF